MNKKIVALAVAAAFAVPAAASAQTTLFGQVKYEVGYIDGGEEVDGQIVNGDNNLVHSYKGTRLGVRGSEDLGGGLQGIFQLRAGFSGVNSPMENSSFRLNEENWVGLKGGFGTLLLGRSDTAMKKTGSWARAFTDTLAEPSLRNESNDRAEGIHYATPSIGGLNGYLTVEPNGTETDSYYAIGASYKLGAFYVAAAFEDAPDTGTFSQGSLSDESNWQVGGKFTFGAGDVGVLYQAVDDGDTDVLLIPVNFKVTPKVNLRAAAKYVDEDASGEDWTNFGVGAQYMFSKRTEAFVNIWADDQIGQTSAGGNTADDSTHFGLGVRHSF